jgi:SNF2 family DNA or RNA helicase
MSKTIILANAENGWVEVGFSFDWEVIEALREIPGRRFLSHNKSNLIPSGQIQNFKNLLPNWTFVDKTVDSRNKPLKIYIENDSFYTIPEYQPLGKKDLRLNFLRRPRDGYELYKFLKSEGKEVELFDKVKNVPLQFNQKATLYPFQEDAINFLRKNEYSGLLALDMGLGKSVVASKAMEEIGNGPFLIAAPASLLTQWKNELEKHFDFHNAEIVTAKIKKNERKKAFENADVVITNYEFLKLIPIEKQFELLILDEIQRVKNWKTQIAKAVANIPARRVIGLSGTPLDNRLQELYNVIDAIRPAYFGTMRQFYRKYIVQENGSKTTYKNLEEVYQRLNEVMFRVSVEDVKSQLPQVTKQTIEVPLSNKELSFYREMVKSFDTVIESISHAKVFACSSAMKMEDLNVSSKEKELIKIIDDLEERAVVNMFYKKEVRRLEDLIDKPVFCLDGDVKQSERSEIAKEFEATNDGILLMTSVGTFGLNLQKTRIQINMDLEWTDSRMKQRLGRVHRLESPHERVFSLILMSEGTIDKYIMELIEYKKELFEITIDGKSENQVKKYIAGELEKEMRTW